LPISEDYINAIHNEKEIKRFAEEHIGIFFYEPICISIQLILGLPLITCELYEFEPKDHERWIQSQYYFNLETQESELQMGLSAPVTFKNIGINPDILDTYECYVTMIAINTNHMQYCAKKVFFEDEHGLLSQILSALVTYQSQHKDEVSQLTPMNAQNRI
jgi:hypothetical protein